MPLKFGFSGDEDQGLMGSPSSLMEMGLFKMKSGAELTPKVDIGSPIFDKITIHLNMWHYEGDKIEIKTRNNSEANRYIQEAKWNDTNLRDPEINHMDLTKGWVLKLEMGNRPNKR